MILDSLSFYPELETREATSIHNKKQLNRACPPNYSYIRKKTQSKISLSAIPHISENKKFQVVYLSSTLGKNKGIGKSFL